MKLGVLISELQKLSKTHGDDIDVRLQTDHGQCLMVATWCGVSHIESDEYMAEDVDEDGIKIIEIQAF